MARTARAIFFRIIRKLFSKISTLNFTVVFLISGTVLLFVRARPLFLAWCLLFSISRTLSPIADDVSVVHIYVDLLSSSCAYEREVATDAAEYIRFALNEINSLEEHAERTATAAAPVGIYCTTIHV